MSFSSGSSPGDSPASGTARTSRVRAQRMTAQEFGSQFRASTRVMWLIAVGIVGDAAEAEDVVQEAAMIAYRKRDTFEPGTSFRAWVGTIVRNVAMNALRSSRRRRGLVEEWTEAAPPSVSSTPSEMMNGTTLPDHVVDSRVIKALADMGDVARACLLLRTVGDLHYAEIASLLSIPEGTAMSHVHRGRAHLRERLARVWQEHAGDSEVNQRYE